jgi:hypothetical protein
MPGRRTTLKIQMNAQTCLTLLVWVRHRNPLEVLSGELVL